ncbi:peroxiredoxin [Salirhabdus euzebyi]|uniref:Peroxiredoxin n=1 Tax=Salirhabdus euzebyi TaxID=394506 RepID=A0A841Q4X9_9BACI|nr:TlpA disulfide reductase family protein [Salirhabdus euzebyi]MBB6453466.1 peroxiredoxin [Salirhabdus euzebyi]
MHAPTFSLPYLTDSQKVYHLSEDLAKKVIILTFWVSWCPDCAIDLPKKEHLFDNLPQDKISLKTINVSGREKTTEEAILFSEKFLKQPVLKDNDREVYNMYGCKGVPTTVLIDKNGKITNVFDDKADFLDIISALGNIT